MTPEERRRALMLVDRHTTGRQSIKRTLLGWLTEWLRTLGQDGFYTADVSAAVEAVRNAQAMTAGQTWAYLDSLGTHAVGTPDLPDHPRGVEQDVVWQRPLKEYRVQRDNGVEHAAAVDAAVRRARIIADDDLTLAMRMAAQQHASKAPGVTGLRRVVHPELSEGGTCGLCLAASDRVYSVRKLLPMHARCKCTVAEVTRSNDPGNGLNNLSLGDLYEAAGGTGSKDLKGTRYKIDEHGELGPVLVAKAEPEYTPSPAQRQRDTAKDEARLTAIEQAIEDLEKRAEQGEDVTLQLEQARKVRSRLLTRLAA